MTSHAIFLQRGLYYLTGDLLSYQLDFLTDEDFQEISYMAAFVALSYAPWFFKSSWSSDSPLNRVSIDTVIHPQLVPMTIGSDKVTIGEKRALLP